MNRGAVKRDGRAARWADHREARRAELVGAALQAARRFGADCGLAEIAAEAGVTKPVLYRHFDDKDDLLRAVLAAIAGEVFLPAMAAGLDPAEPDERALVEGAIGTYVGLLSSERPLYDFARAHSAVAGGDFVGSMEDALAQALVALGRFRGGGSALAGEGPGPLTTAYAVVGAVQLAVHRWLLAQDLTAEELVRTLSDLVWQGLAPRNG